MYSLKNNHCRLRDDTYKLHKNQQHIKEAVRSFIKTFVTTAIVSLLGVNCLSTKTDCFLSGKKSVCV